MSGYRIPFNLPAIVGDELSYIGQAIRMRHISGGGWFTRACESMLEQAIGVKCALLTTSCTHALEMAALLLEIRPGDEIIVPSFAFVSTANAFALRGATLVFADVREDTLNLDEGQLERLVSDRTRAIVVVHYGGVGCEMDRIMAIANQAGVPVVEDNAHGLFGQFKGQYLGTFGCLATQSFHETKNITCGEGGALLINDERFKERAEIIRDKGTDRGKLLRGQIDRYTWVDIGSSYVPSEILAAYLFAQLRKWETIQCSRRRTWERYVRGLSSWADEHGVRLPSVPAYCQQSYHVFYLILPSTEIRQALIGHLSDCGILSVFHYTPLHLSTMGNRHGGRAGMCPVTEQMSERILRLPLYNGLDETDVVSAIRRFKC